jgi:hypothetical protein
MDNFKFAVCYPNDNDLAYSRTVMNDFLKSVATVYGFQCTIHPDHQVPSELRSNDPDEIKYICDIACFESSYDKVHGQKLVEALNLIRKESEMSRFVMDFFQTRL